MTEKKKGGKDAVAAAVKSAKLAPAKAAKRGTPARTPAFMTKRFVVRDGWLVKLGDEGSNDLYICSAFEIVAESRDANGRSWGFLIGWGDRRGSRHEEIYLRSLFARDGAEFYARLADGGVTFNVHPAARTGLFEYINVVSAKDLVLSVERPGWHGGVFVLPNAVFGPATERVFLQTPDREAGVFNTSGTLVAWQKEISSLCIGNSRLIFAVCCAFAAPLLGVVGEQGGGFNLCGQARTGKTTAALIAASVWGGNASNGAKGYIRTCRATGNGLEAIGIAHCDTLLVLDELGEIDANDVGHIAYMLANGQTKLRANRQGGSARESIQFRVLFLTTGEVGLQEKNTEAGRDTKAGQEVRWIKVPSDAGGSHGLLEELHDAPSAGAFIEELKEGTAQNYGTAAPAFLTRLTDELHKNPEFPSQIRDRAQKLLDTWLKPYGDAGGQVRSLGFRFALVAVAGELATEWQITWWKPGDAAWGVGKCFQAALAERGTLGAREAEQAVAKMRGYLLQHGDARFVKWVDKRRDDAAQFEEDDAPDKSRMLTQNRAGWKRWTRRVAGRSLWIYYLTAEAMNEALRGLNYRDSLATLVARGFIVSSPDGKTSRSMTPPGEPKVRLYEIHPSIFDTSEGDLGRNHLPAGDGPADEWKTSDGAP